jgi:hypothetical protein
MTTIVGEHESGVYEKNGWLRNSNGRYWNPETEKWVINKPASVKTGIISRKRVYSHPEVDPILKDLFPKPQLRQSIQYALKHIALRECNFISRKIKSSYLERRSQQLPDSDPWIWIHSEFFRRILGNNYKSVMMKLVNCGLLELDYKIRYQKRPMPLYRFKDKTLLSGYNLKPIEFNPLEKKIDGYLAWSKRYYRPLDVRVIKMVCNEFDEIRLSLEQVREILRMKYRKNYLVRHKAYRDHPDLYSFKSPPRIMTESEYLSHADLYMNIINAWNNSDPAERSTMLSVDPFGNRLHSPFSRMPSEFRAYLYDAKGNYLQFMGFDMANAQHTIALHILKTKFECDVSGTNYYNDVISGEFYDRVKERLGLPNKKMAKGITFNWLYAFPDSRAQRTAIDMYGYPFVIFRDFKMEEYDENGDLIPFLKRHARLPQIMQQEESRVFRKIWKKLMHEDFVFLPVHDAVYVTRLQGKGVRIVRNVMRSILKYELDVPAELNEEAVYPAV